MNSFKSRLNKLEIQTKPDQGSILLFVSKISQGHYESYNSSGGSESIKYTDNDIERWKMKQEAAGYSGARAIIIEWN